MPSVTFRLTGPALPPRRTEPQVPGWGGEPEPRADGSAEHPWQCVPFSEAARYGIEVLFPYAQELRVAKRRGRLVAKVVATEALEGSPEPPPIVSVAERFYLFPIDIDLKVPPGWAIRTEPHPSFYTDPADCVPLALPGLIRASWWPMATSLVFKSPSEGRTHVFRPGEPFVQIIVVPEEANLDLQPMDVEAAAERELQARRIEASRDTLAEKSRWVSSSKIEFDGAYRHMLRAAKAKARKS